MPRPEFPNAMVMPYPPASAAFTNFPDLFKQLTVLKILDDFESPRTRQEALQLAISRPFFATMGVALVAISEQPLGSAAFVAASGWKGALYLDLYKNVCREALPAPSKNQSRLGATLRRVGPRARFQVGGTYLVSPELRILYAHGPRDADSPSVAKILNICYSTVTPAPRRVSLRRVGTKADRSSTSSDESFVFQ